MQENLGSAHSDAVQGEKRIHGASQDLEHVHAKGLPYPVGDSEAYDQSVDSYSAGVNERGNEEMRRVC